MHLCGTEYSEVVGTVGSSKKIGHTRAEAYEIPSSIPSGPNVFPHPHGSVALAAELTFEFCYYRLPKLSSYGKPLVRLERRSTWCCIHDG
jgi:hypothetical protein